MWCLHTLARSLGKYDNSTGTKQLNQTCEINICCLYCHISIREMFWGIMVKEFLAPYESQDSSERNTTRVTQTLQIKQAVMALVIL